MQGCESVIQEMCELERLQMELCKLDDVRHASSTVSTMIQALGWVIYNDGVKLFDDKYPEYGATLSSWVRAELARGNYAKETT